MIVASSPPPGRFVNVISPPALRTIVKTSASEQTVAGTLFGQVGGNAEGRITEINGFRLEALPQGHMLLTRNRDIPGIIGKIGAVNGRAFGESPVTDRLIERIEAAQASHDAWVMLAR